MSSAASSIVAHVATYVVAAVLIGVLSFLARRRRKRDRAHSERWRLPGVVGFLAWVIIAFGVIMVLSAILSEPSPYDDSDDTGLLVGGIFVLALGIFSLILYRNWWVVLGDDVIDFQTVTGRRKSIRYADIISYDITHSNGMPMITIKSADRTKLTLNPRFVDATPLSARAEFARVFGHWPTREEFAQYVAAEQARAVGQPGTYDRPSDTGVGPDEDGYPGEGDGPGQATHPQSPATSFDKPAPSSDKHGRASQTPSPFSQPKRRPRRDNGPFS